MGSCRLLLASVLLVAGSLAAPAADLVTSLPGANFTINFKQYSGYLNASATKRFHYWFTETARNPASAPVLLWLNGGPGCSSVGGLIEELGPFHISDNGSTVYLNPYAWNRVGNVIFLESPAGVGYSYDTTGNVATNDDEVAQHNYNALLDFFTLFPEYKNNDFYITGESYGGVYIPTLAVKVAADKTNFPKFQGVAIGNGIYSFPLNANTLVPLLYYHGIVRQSLYDEIRTRCCSGNIESCDFYTISNNNDRCGDLVNELYNQGPDLDPYNLYDTCYLDNPTGTKQRGFIRRTLLSKMTGRQFDLKSSKAAGLPLCAQSDNTEIYLNRADVRTALHIPSTLGRWTDCSNAVGYLYKITHEDVKPEFESLIASKIRILTYNGDVDTVCNFALNKQFVASLNLTLRDHRTSSVEWKYHQETPNVAGFYTPYTGNLDFLTVRGSGHFVPHDRPREALQFIYNFIHQREYSQPIPSNI